MDYLVLAKNDHGVCTIAAILPNKEGAKERLTKFEAKQPEQTYEIQKAHAGRKFVVGDIYSKPKDGGTHGNQR